VAVSFIGGQSDKNQSTVVTCYFPFTPENTRLEVKMISKSKQSLSTVFYGKTKLKTADHH
jgi:hypothetical protein